MELNLFGWKITSTKPVMQNVCMAQERNNPTLQQRAMDTCILPAAEDSTARIFLGKNGSYSIEGAASDVHPDGVLYVEIRPFSGELIAITLQHETGVVHEV